MPIVYNLIIINALVWLFSVTNMGHHLVSFDLFDTFGLHYWDSSSFRPWQLVSYCFFHDLNDFTHLLFNMFNLWMFGTYLEKVWGGSRFLLFYVVCVVGGAFAQELFWSVQHAGESAADMVANVLPYAVDPHGLLVHEVLMPDGSYATSCQQIADYILRVNVLVGASAGVFGVMVAFAMKFPNLPLFLFFIPIPIKAKYIIGFFSLLEVFFALQMSNDGVSHLGHLGGIVFGILLILWWRHTGEDNGSLV